MLSRVVPGRHAPRARAELGDRRRRPERAGPPTSSPARSSNSSPTWSPDGRWIAFASDRDDEDDWDIFVVDANGGPAKQLTDNDVEDVWPDWSPDGRLIAFSRGDIEELESSIHVMRPDGKGVRRVPLMAPADSHRAGSRCRRTSAVERGELGAVALELLALGGHDVRRRVRDEALVREHALRPRDLLAQPLDLGVAVAVDPRALGADDGREDPALVVRAELDLHAAAAEDLRGLLDAVESARIRRRSVSSASGHGRDDQARRAIRELRPDLLGDVRHHRMQEREQPLERRQRGRDRRRVAVVEPRLDRLRVPVAEVVEREVVERRRRLGEVEACPRVLELGTRGVEAREDPALLEVARLELPASTPSAFWRMSRATFQSLIASLRPSSIAPYEKRTSCVDEIFKSP